MSSGVQAFPFVARQRAAQPALFEPLDEALDLHTDWRHFLTHDAAAHDLLKRVRVYRQSRLAWLASVDATHPYEQHGWALEQCSRLAELMLGHVYQETCQAFAREQGVVRDAHGQVVSLLVYALGKLGGGELNYSSDVDLVFVYPRDGRADGGRELDAASYFEKLCQRMIRAVDSITADGQLYRVDTRLRPFGSAGALAVSAAALSAYLLNEGREWERFAWMRAHRVCGDAAQSLPVREMIDAFVYRKHLDYSVFESLLDIKREQAAIKQRDPHNLKLGEGGIREIEFIVQTLQLAYGGRDPALRGRGIVQVLEALTGQGKMLPVDRDRLLSAWLYLRKCENLSQLLHDRQVHHLPDDATELEWLAQAMGHDHSAAFLGALAQQRRRVQRLYSALLAEQNNPWQEVHSDTDALQRAAELTRTHTHRALAPDARAKVRRLWLQWLQRTPDAVVIERLGRLMNAIAHRSTYVLMLVQEAIIRDKLYDLISRGGYFVERFSRHPALLEILFEDEALPTDLNSEWLRGQWRRVVRADAEDEEQWMEDVRFFRQATELRVMMACVSGRRTELQCGVDLARVAEYILRAVIVQAHRDVCERLGEDVVAADALMVIAYGSLAAENMHPDSDLDLVFIVDLDVLDAPVQHFVLRWIRRIMHHLTSRTFHGELYPLDLQLRPEGHSGAMVVSLLHFIDYQKTRAWTWEHLALLRSRVVYGDADQVARFGQCKRDILMQPRAAEDIERDVADMARRLQSAGLQRNQLALDLTALVLRHVPDCPQLLEHNRTEAWLDALLSAGVLSPDAHRQWLDRHASQQRRRLRQDLN